jgi:cation diffusion facilitator CzcD-associated flavoprotein CzcO
MTTSLDQPKLQEPISSAQYDAVVVGAGPYGLATAAHLLARGLNVAICGKPLNLWREHMPEGMLLRSYWWATSISDPQRRYSMEQFFQETGRQPFDPLTIEMFIEYGLWYQRHVVPNVDEAYVETIEQKENFFTVTLADGRVVQSQTVVLAPGLRYYPHCPDEYNVLPDELVSHTSDHSTFERFIGKQVVVIGGGQSALETAALAQEKGAHVQLVTRSSLVWIEGSGSFPEHRPLIERLRAPKAGISPSWFNWRLEHFPYAFQRLPRSTRDELLRGRGRYGPMGAAWLKPRVEEQVIVHEGLRVQEVKEADNGAHLVLSNNQTLKADHVILGTGYRVDVKRLPMIHQSMLPGIQTYQDAPVLNNYFETSLSGLYFVGFSTVSSCGPLFRFVVGTEATARRVADAVASRVAGSKRGKVFLLR